ncbi:MAG: hypothetical protein U0W40_11730 [Acidimicrobiia bacterium]
MGRQWEQTKRFREHPFLSAIPFAIGIGGMSLAAATDRVGVAVAIGVGAWLILGIFWSIPAVWRWVAERDSWSEERPDFLAHSPKPVEPDGDAGSSG